MTTIRMRVLYEGLRPGEEYRVNEHRAAFLVRSKLADYVQVGRKDVSVPPVHRAMKSAPTKKAR